MIKYAYYIKNIRRGVSVSLLFFLLMPAFAQNAIPEGFSSLFNGKDFTGWDIQPDKGAWKVENGTIHCYGKPNDPYFIISEKKYENFELYLDFRMSPKCNSGVTIHLIERDHGRESRMGMEIQVSDDAGNAPDVHSCAAIYDVAPPLLSAVKPAKHWNTYHIIMDWPMLVIELNGQIVQNENMDKNPRLKYRLRNGHIGLQNHGREVEYRNIYIKELPSKEPQWKELFNGKDLKNWETKGEAEWKVENGEITAAGGSGYLISGEIFNPNYELQVFAAKDENSGGGNSGVFYNWENETDRGYKTEFYDKTSAVKLKYMDDRFLPTQIINLAGESVVILNGIEVQRNAYRTSPAAGRIAVYHSAKDGKIKIKKIRIKQIED
ncbi:MAG: DUF1080 domain-containing protein [Prevotellaceae bacterium]|jgi:hypothetical protein|nr:DUF1080 domain-containing protein [Prevotellaceae bacterium]